MTDRKIAMKQGKKIALVAHDNKKLTLLEWARYNRELLSHHKVYATGTTGEILERELGFEIRKLQSGPLGGDQQIGAKIAEGEIDKQSLDKEEMDREDGTYDRRRVKGQQPNSPLQGGLMPARCCRNVGNEGHVGT